jgi:hypothetical protein
VSHINELYGGNEALERLQRRDARFFNTCMMMTALGAAVSDALDDGRVVSGVGGQYNFVAMAHALHDGRSVLMLRSTRRAGGRRCPNVLWNYGHTTIPRHLRDIAITEYGAADLRGRTDEECAQAMLGLCDAAHHAALLARARAAGKIAADWTPPATHAEHRPEVLAGRLRPYRQLGLLPDYPLGSDFTPVEQRIAKALGWLREATDGGLLARLRTVARAWMFQPEEPDREAMVRMQLHETRTRKERLEAKLLALALERTDGKTRS